MRSPFFIYTVALSWLLLCAISSAQVASEKGFVINGMKLVVINSESTKKLTESIVYPSSLDNPIELSQGDRLIIKFNIQDKETKKGIQPHQSMLILSSKQIQNQVAIIVTVRNDGKASVELDMKSAPEDLSSPGNYSLNLIIGTFSHNNPINYHIGNVNIDAPYTSNVPVKYGPKPEIHHTFKSDQKLPPIVISYSFMIIVLLPWLFLIVAWMRIGVNASLMTNEPGSLPAIISFLLTLLAIEILFYNYWTHLNIFQTLSWLSGLSILAFLLGRKALVNVQEWRLKGLR